ncbi:hypothetical protein H6G54_03870 [Anabaena cylindrica FACHB-243]|uniref:Uncharacterized protein n=1 Tax=Anabaena cylindrica (strain ATCC 27899 / PCC 7122) TaxID=272123 RepID=K9ZL66_ANACC|nr:MULTISPECIES: hypothetical protein [Anabaena]AFZ59277.1 hypothetical protein Anacy_3905 [Anabaena cylindrica PCC 7122]MBD2416864.1 hypothetical protein [Anabaena cylindrica FACHB-243]MCM2405194.1 hypothetical protein [Anabaena sp. CCAP 1446/1C]BAY03684.1 hypothetical protein NIES19_29380 [Anabaena cylindrica PCC 7122]
MKYIRIFNQQRRFFYDFSNYGTHEGKPNKKKTSPGQMSLPWNEWEATDPEIKEVADKFVFANCYAEGRGSTRYRKP